MFNIPPLIIVENPWWLVLIAPAFAGFFIGIILWIINTLDKLSATRGWFGVEKITAEEYSKRWKASRENLVAEVESGKPLHEIDVAEISPQTLILRRLQPLLRLNPLAQAPLRRPPTVRRTIMVQITSPSTTAVMGAVVTPTVDTAEPTCSSGTTLGT